MKKMNLFFHIVHYDELPCFSCVSHSHTSSSRTPRLTLRLSVKSTTVAAASADTPYRVELGPATYVPVNSIKVLLDVSGSTAGSVLQTECAYVMACTWFG